MLRSIVISGIAIVFSGIVCFAAAGAKMKITSAAFQENGNIPTKFTCDGAGLNPALHFEATPTQAKSLALIVDDPHERRIRVGRRS
jgi:phosphatidylethanolamine-binding protein (PEBP) family uncharacterized protein